VSTDLCLYEVRDGVAVVTFNRPERNNGMTGALELAYFARLAEANEDRAARAVVVTGAGRSFCPGADLGHRGEPGDEPLPNTKVPTTFPAPSTSRWWPPSTAGAPASAWSKPCSATCASPPPRPSSPPPSLAGA